MGSNDSAGPNLDDTSGHDFFGSLFTEHLTATINFACGVFTAFIFECPQCCIFIAPDFGAFSIDCIGADMKT